MTSLIRGWCCRYFRGKRRGQPCSNAKHAGDRLRWKSHAGTRSLSMRHILNSRVFSRSIRRELTASRLRKGAVWCGIPRADARGSQESGDRNLLYFPQRDRRAPRGLHDARRALLTLQKPARKLLILRGRGSWLPRLVFGLHDARRATATSFAVEAGSGFYANPGRGLRRRSGTGLP